MKKLAFLSILILMVISCGKDKPDKPVPNLDFREEMRDFVIGISDYGKTENSEFVIIPQNGIELISQNGEGDGNLHTTYLKAIDGHGQEDLFYGYDADNKESPTAEREYIQQFLDRSHDEGKTILVTDYCSAMNKMDDANARNTSAGFISFAADHRELDNIPDYPDPIHNENTEDITDLSQIKNFLYLINPENFSSKTEFINEMRKTNYDLIIMDLFFTEDESFTAQELSLLKYKASGAQRMVVSYMSIGEAEDYRYYWQSDWNVDNTSWLDKENPDWAGNYKVHYWAPEWQAVIYGDQDSYLQKILDAGFDGVYLDIIDAYEFFE